MSNGIDVLVSYLNKYKSNASDNKHLIKEIDKL